MFYPIPLPHLRNLNSHITPQVTLCEENERRKAEKMLIAFTRMTKDSTG